MMKDEMVGWHEFEQILVNSERQRSLVCCLYGVEKNQT